MGMDVGKKGGLKSDINVTPMVDVVLVLLIIFMVITPLAQRGYDIEAPKESENQTPPPQTDIKNIMMAVTEQDCAVANPLGVGDLPPNCTVRINNEPVQLRDLPRRLDEIMRVRKKSDKILFIAVQEKLNYEAVVRILDVAKNAVGEDLKIAVVSNEKLAFPQAGL